MIPTRHPMAEIIERRGALIIDGAMSTALESLGMVLNDSLWSARALIEHPEYVREVHRRYFEAGANAAITDSYQATEMSFGGKGFSREATEGYIRRSAELAREAKNDVLLEHPDWLPGDLIIAGAIGPYGAYLADGSEYTGAYSLTRDEYVKFHELRLNALLDGGADILAIETQPRLDEIEAILSMIEKRDITCWVTVTLKDGEAMPDGTAPEKLAEVLDANPQVEAFGLNCVKREWVEPALEKMRAKTKRPLVVYPNSGETYDPVTKTWHAQGPHEPSWQHFVPLWEKTGALCIGGCCRTLPRDIEEISKIIEAQKKA